MLRLNSTAVRVSGGTTFVTMMEPAHLWDRDDPTGFWCLDGAWLGRVLLQAQVRATPMIIVHEFSEVAIQAGFTEHDHVIQTLTANRTDHPLDVCTAAAALRVLPAVAQCQIPPVAS